VIRAENDLNSEVIRAVIVHTYKEFKCDYGMIIGYDYNAIIVIVQEEIQRELEFFVQSIRN
jgi:ribosomal protein L14